MPQVAVDQNGNAVFVWQHFDGTDPSDSCCFRIEARTRSAAGTLGPVLSLSTAGQNASQPQVAVDPNGNATFVWKRADGSDPANNCCFRVQARTRSATGTLGSVTTLSGAGQNTTDPQVEVDPDGNAIFAWARSDGSDPTNHCCFRVQTRSRSATGTLGAVQDLSAAGEHASQPQVGVDGNGNAVFVWSRFDGSDDIIEARARSAAGTLSSTQALSANGQDAFSPQVAVDPNGNAMFVWERPDNSFTNHVQGRARSAAGSLSGVQDISDPGLDAFSPQVAIDTSGTAAIVWAGLDSTFTSRIQARTRSAGGTLSTIDLLSPADKDSFSPQVAVDPSGNAVFVWSGFDDTFTSRIQARTRSAGGTLSTVPTLSAAAQNASEPQVALDPNGNAVFGWSRVDGTYSRIQARSRSATGTLSIVALLSSVGQEALSPQVAVDSNGNAVFVWAAFDGTNPGNNCCFVIQARRRSATGILGPVETLSGAGQNASEVQVAVDPNGNAIFVWKRFDGTNDRIQARSRSATGTLSTVQSLSAAGQDGSAPQVAVDPNGNAVFDWVAFDGTNDVIQARARSVAGTLAPVETLSSTGAATPQVAVDPNGNAVFAWARFNGTDNVIQTRARSAAGSLSTTKTLSGAGQDASAPQVGVDSNGNAVVVWARFDGANDVIQARTLSATGTLGNVQHLSAAGQDASVPQIGVDPTGRTVFTWQRSNGTNDRIQARARSATGTLSAIQDVSAAGQDASVPQVAIQPNGNAVFVWTRFDGTSDVVQARNRFAASGALGAVQDLSLSVAGKDASVPQVAVDPTGKAYATWQRFDGRKFRIEGSVGP